MEEKERQFITVCIDDLVYPMLIGQKAKVEGNNTLTKIMVKADIESKYEQEFESSLLEIINDHKVQVGPIQLINRMIAYINSINSRKFNISLKYPLLLSGGLQKKIIRYNCENSVRKTSLINYMQSYKVDIPVIIVDTPLNIIVGIEGFESIFAEDIIETVEQAIYGNSFDIIKSKDLETLILEKINMKFFNQYSIDSCSVKILTRKLSHKYSTEISARNIILKDQDKLTREQLIQ